MPSTYNGIGTRYSGQSNAQTRPGVCQYCRRQAQLKSYDTRLWFVVLYIPVIPLGRKRITDYCPYCSRHYVGDLKKWEEAKKLSVSSSLQEFHQNPTPDNAIQVHRQLIVFRQYKEAGEFRSIIGPQFNNDARVQGYLGSELASLGQSQEALTYYRRALELSPDMPEAKAGIALDLIRNGKLDEARRLLVFLEQPGAVQTYSLTPLETLANAYQNIGRHADALALYALLLKELPAVGQHKGFRKRVKTSEKALKISPTILPKKKFSLGGLFRGGGGRVRLIVVGAVVCAIVVGMLAQNEYTRRHRPLYIVNGFEKPVTVTIDGYGDVRVAGYAHPQISLPEGKYHAHITGAVEQDVDFQIASGYFDRWSESPAWVLNPGGAALLEMESGHYRSDNPRPTDHDFYFGQTFTMFPQIDHPFGELPHSTEVDSNQSEKTLTNLNFASAKPADIIGYLVDNGHNSEAFKMAQWDLNLHPDDMQVLNEYSALAAREPEHAKFIQFLHDGLGHRPVAVEWHRLYQDSVRRTPGSDASLRDAYDAMLRKEPGNSALLYLRGRIAEREEGLRYFHRALDLDPKNAYAYYALGYDAVARGEWQEATPLLSHAIEYATDPSAFIGELNTARFGTGDYASVEKSVRDRLRTDPLGAGLDTELVTALVAEKRDDEALKEVANFEAADRKAGAPDPDRLLYMVFLDATNKASQILQMTPTTDDGKYLRGFACMELGHPEQAETIISLQNEADDNSFFDLAMATAWLLKGDQGHASTWIARASKLFPGEGDDDSKHLVKILAASTPPSVDEVKDLMIPSRVKSLLAAWLALRYPAQAAPFADMAEHFNVRLTVPHNLVALAVAKVRAAP